MPILPTPRPWSSASIGSALLGGSWQIGRRAVETDSCLYDPNCMLANRGVDHGCLQLPETACQCWNWFLSRWELFGEPSAAPDRIIGYWEPAIDASAPGTLLDVRYAS